MSEAMKYEEVIGTIRKWPAITLAGLFFEVGASAIRSGAFRENGGFETFVERIQAFAANEKAIAMFDALSEKSSIPAEAIQAFHDFCDGVRNRSHVFADGSHLDEISRGQRHDMLCAIIDRPLSTWEIYKAGFIAAKPNPLAAADEAETNG